MVETFEVYVRRIFSISTYRRVVFFVYLFSSSLFNPVKKFKDRV